MECNPEVKKIEKVEDLENKNDVPSIYVGETSRSIKERALEHWKDFESRDTDSHILKHWELHHGGQGSPRFKMTVVRTFRDALSRQVAEAIRIMLRKNTLNSKNGYNRCSITRLVMEEKEIVKEDTPREEDGQVMELHREGLDRLEAKRLEQNSRKKVGRPGTWQASKRKEAEKETFVKSRASKRRKYNLIDTNWGLENTTNMLKTENKSAFLQSAPELVHGSTMQSMIRVWTGTELWVRREFIFPMVDNVMAMQMEVAKVMDEAVERSVEIVNASKMALIEMVMEVSNIVDDDVPGVSHQ